MSKILHYGYNTTQLLKNFILCPAQKQDIRKSNFSLSRVFKILFSEEPNISIADLLVTLNPVTLDLVNLDHFL